MAMLKNGHKDRACNVRPSVGSPIQKRVMLQIISQKAGNLCKFGGGEKLTTFILQTTLKVDLFFYSHVYLNVFI